jgi:Mrp family chromosome partitioning ATPase/capsular polysaccharide biosynthesis protein
MTKSDRSATSGLVRLGGVFARRRWVWLPFVIVTPLIVFLSTRSDPPSYSASAEVFLNLQNQLYGGVGDPTVWEQFRTMDTQLRLATLPAIGYEVADALELHDRDGASVGAQTSAASLGNTDIIRFTTTDPSPVMARRIATEYARQYVAFRQDFDTATLSSTIAGLDHELRRLERAGQQGGAAYQDVQSKRRQLATAVELQRGNTTLVREADTASRVTPRWRRDAVEALVLALIAGLGLAYVIDALDFRLRTPGDIAEALGATLLATVPLPRRPVLRRRARGTLVTRMEPESEAEGIRRLRQSVELVSSPSLSGVLLVTSAAATGTKEPVAARLALALARGGASVGLVDVDLRDPTLHRLFGIPAAPGVTDVLRGAPLRDVSQPVAVDRPDERRLVSLGAPPPTPAEARGRLEIVPAGVVDVESAEALTGLAAADLVEALRERTDLVLLEGPPLMTSSDALLLARHADGLVLVAGAGTVTLGSSHEVVQAVRRAGTPVLGVVVTERLRRPAAGPAQSRRPVPRHA